MGHAVVSMELIRRIGINHGYWDAKTGAKNPKKNPYGAGTDCYEAWEDGYDLGRFQAEDETLEVRNVE